MTAGRTWLNGVVETGVPAAAELDDELADELDTYVPIDVSTLGNIFP